jgi:chromosome partitioning protein
MKTIIFFNNKGGVGKTTLVYHITYMLAELGKRCLAVDLDPQANLTSMCLPDDALEGIYEKDNDRPTILAGIKLLDRGIGDIQPVTIHHISEGVGLLAGDLELSLFEDKLSENWGKTLNRDEAAFRITAAFSRIIEAEGKNFNADFCIVDVGPNFGAINRSTMISGDYSVVPMAADLFSLQGLRNLGERLATWKLEWEDRKNRNPDPLLDLPNGAMKPLGYVVMQHGIKESRPVKSYLAWANRIPGFFQKYVLGKNEIEPNSVEEDSNCLAMLKHYHSLIPMAMEARKPIFLLKPADGAIGAHTYAVQRAHQDFEALTKEILRRMDI